MKERLYAPGPCAVPERVLNAMHRPMIHHRSQAFEALFEDCRRGFFWLLESREAPLILSSSGTGAFEAAIVNFFSKKDVMLCITGGKSGSNWMDLCQKYGFSTAEIAVPWGQAVDVQQVQEKLFSDPRIKGVICVANETSTGTRQPYEAIGKMVASRKDCLFIVDGIGAIGVMDVLPERDSIDLLIMSSPKGLMLPPGLGFVWASPKAWEYHARSDLPKYYFDLGKERLAQMKFQTAYTPAVSLLYGLREAFSMMQEEGRKEIILRHKRLSEGTRAGIKALGLSLFSQAPSEAVTSVVHPRTIDLCTHLREFAHLTVGEGQAHLKGKIMRIGHMGYVDELDMMALLLALEGTLTKLGLRDKTTGAPAQAAAPIFWSLPH